MTGEQEAAFAALGLGGYDWPNVFKYASGAGEGGSPEAVPEGTSVPATVFDVGDVARLEGTVDGEPDERSWVAWGLLKDGRWFCVEASCDYTGWG